MNIRFNISDISTHRSELMGWAILWVMMLHFTFTQIKPLGFIAQYGYAGVDIFMMVSGLGLFFSLERHKSIITYFSNRLLRIFPTYYILGIFSSTLVYHDTFTSYLFRYSTIGFWTGHYHSEWYIPSITLLYIIFPQAKKLFDKRHFIIILLICIAIIIISYTIVEKEYIYKSNPYFFLLYRIPAFLFGIMCAYWIKNDTSSKYYILILLICIPIFIILYPNHHRIYNYKYLSTLFLLPLLIIFYISVTKILYIFKKSISTIGNASLEIYIIQGMFFSSITSGVISIPQRWHDIISILLITTCTLLGIAAHYLMSVIVFRKIRRNTNERKS